MAGEKKASQRKSTRMHVVPLSEVLRRTRGVDEPAPAANAIREHRKTEPYAAWDTRNAKAGDK